MYQSCNESQLPDGAPGTFPWLHLMLTSAALVRLGLMLRAFVLNELTESLIDWNPTYFSIALIKFVSLSSILN